MRHGLFLLLGVIGFAAGPVAHADNATDSDPAGPEIGIALPDFRLADARGKEWTPSEVVGEKGTVLLVLGTECPLAKLYTPRINELAAEYGEKGIGFVGLNANAQDSLTELAAYVRRHEIAFPVLKDLGNKLADELAAVRTPEAFLFDADGKLVYWGRIDDQYGVGYIREAVTREDLRLALDATLAGRPVETPKQTSVGCYIGRVTTPDPTAEVTYSNQIARILQKRCVECHREGEIAPFSLTDYDEVAGWADTIFEVVEDERMPPWHAAPEHGDFANDRRLTDEEKGQIYAWVRAGAPEGDPQQLPEPIEYETGWQLPQQPDLVVAMRDKPFDVPAEGVVRYQYFSVDPGFTEDKWIKAAEIIPGNRAVVHHVIVAIRPPKGKDPGVTPGEFLTAYVPGLRAKPYPDGMAKRIPAGSKFIFQMHYTPIGSPQQDLSKIGLVFTDPETETITHAVVTQNTINTKIKIPPREADHRMTSLTRPAPEEVLLLSMSPHMHLRGKSFKYEAVLPDGSTEVLLDVPRYDFNWQTGYELSEPKTLPKGTRIKGYASFDNSEGNLANPDPGQTVRWGDQTWDEMMIGYFDIAIPWSEARAGGGKDDPVGRLMKKLDTNGDGEIAKDEVAPQQQGLFKRLDKNKDGIVTRKELEALKPFL